MATKSTCLCAGCCLVKRLMSHNAVTVSLWSLALTATGFRRMIRDAARRSSSTTPSRYCLATSFTWSNTSAAGSPKWQTRSSVPDEVVLAFHATKDLVAWGLLSRTTSTRPTLALQRMLGRNGCWDRPLFFLSLLGRHFNMARTCCCVVCCLVQGLRPVCVSRLPPVFLNH